MSHSSPRPAIGLIAIVLLAGICTSFSCSLPSLEKPECSQARDNVKQFYSWQLGTDSRERSAHPETARKFVSSSFSTDPGNVENDPFTLSTTVPKSFRIGKCEVLGPDKVKLEVQLLWRDELDSRQLDVFVEAARSDDRWLITKVTK